MKKLIIVVLAVLMLAAIFVGCTNRNNNIQPTATNPVTTVKPTATMKPTIQPSVTVNPTMSVVPTVTPVLPTVTATK
jgi:uncharacterized secreted protein with C-terminal beta-propeller domain